MNLAERTYQIDNDRSELNRQLDTCKGVTGVLRDFLMRFFVYMDIYSISDIDTTVKEEYYIYVERTFGLSPEQRKYYKSLLEQVEAAYYSVIYSDLKKRIMEIVPSRAVANKVFVSLIEQGIEGLEAIEYSNREVYAYNVKNTVAKSKVNEYIKAFDKVKLETIREDNETYPLRKRELTYKNEKIFLLYHPDYNIGTTFYYVREKVDELVFDFEVKASLRLKKQIFEYLNHILSEDMSRHERRIKVLSLNHLYRFCINTDVEDIEQLTDADIEKFRREITGFTGTQTDKYMQIISGIRRFTYINVPTISWDANTWYFDRMKLAESRLNPSREIKSLNFGNIRNEANRHLFKIFMKYEIGISSKKSLQSIRTSYYDICFFLYFCDAEDIYIEEIRSADIEKYLLEQSQKDIQPETYNRRVIAVERFLEYLDRKGKIIKPVFMYRYYLKRTYPRHNDRAVGENIVVGILKSLVIMPMYMRMMFIILCFSGIRISEVCAIKGDAFHYDGKDAWIRLYQNKMKSEKMIPIPKALYDLMMEYINDNNILVTDYIFKNRRNGAFSADRFSKDFKKYLQEYGITGYSFRSHDFRHTIATYFYESGISIEILRDYMGHKESQMTMQYVDNRQKTVDKLNEEYFSNKENSLYRKGGKI